MSLACHRQRLRRSLDRWLGIPALAALRASQRQRTRAATPPARVLVVKLAAAGDAVLLGPALRALRRALPEARIDWLATPVNAELARLDPSADRVLVLESLAPHAVLGMARRLRAARYELALDFEQWSRGSAILARLGAPFCAGFDTPGQRRGVAFDLPLRRVPGRHEADAFLDLVAAVAQLGPGARGAPRLAVPDAGLAELLARVPELASRARAPRLCLHPGCGADGTPREWPLAAYAALGQRLVRRLGAELYVTGGSDDARKTARLASQLGTRTRDLGGRLSWGATIALASRMDVVVSGNTGLMHVAAALGRPQVALHGPTDPARWGPRNPHAIVLQSRCPRCPCLDLGFEYHARDGSCLRSISVGEVEAAVRQALANRSGPEREPSLTAALLGVA